MDDEQMMIRARSAIARALGGDVLVTVEEWVGCDEDTWKLPVYVTAEAPNREFFDACTDLRHGSFDVQIAWIVEQLLEG